MPTTLVLTRNVPDRFRGFLNSCMLEVVPTVYLSPHMRTGVRNRVWNVLDAWSSLLTDTSGILMLWPNTRQPSGIELRVLGYPPLKLIEHEGQWLVQRAFTAQHDLDHLQQLTQPSTLTPDETPLETYLDTYFPL